MRRLRAIRAQASFMRPRLWTSYVIERDLRTPLIGGERAPDVELATICDASHPDFENLAKLSRCVGIGRVRCANYLNSGAVATLAHLITGSSRGLGLAVATSLAAEGCRVCLCARGEERLRAAVSLVASSARGKNSVIGVAADVSRPEGAREVVDETVEAFGGVDVLVNNVGFAGGAGLLETSDAQWQESFDQTLLPAIRVSRLAVPHMQRRGGGSIVIIASIFGREAGGESDQILFAR